MPVTDNCEQVKASCRCMHPAGHEIFGPHECECGAAWDEEGRIVKYPMMKSDEAKRLAHTLGLVPDSDRAWDWSEEGWVRT